MQTVSMRFSAAYKSAVEDDLLATLRAVCRRLESAAGANHLAWYWMAVAASCRIVEREACVDVLAGLCNELLPEAPHMLSSRVSLSQMKVSYGAISRRDGMSVSGSVPPEAAMLR